MPSQLCISIRFLDATFHGRRDGGEPEWPPSPMRLFQALVAVAARLEPLGIGAAARSTLEWLEQQPEPLIVAPAVHRGMGRSISVPNNAMDIVARAWSRGNESESGDADPRTHRTMKTVRPLWLRGECTVRFFWRLSELEAQEQRHAAVISKLARSIVCLGWGIDMAVGEGALVPEDEVDRFPGEHWRGGARGVASGVRVPVPGTLKDLTDRHERFVSRIGAEGFAAPPPLSQYENVEYRRTTDPAKRSLATFALIKINDRGFRAFDTVRKGLAVAGMLRHATKNAAHSTGWSQDKIDRFVLGHGNGRPGKHLPTGPERFAYLPLPSIESRGQGRATVGSVRRAILATFANGCENEIAWAQRTLAAQELIDEHTGEVVALLSPLASNDKIIEQYEQPSSTWSSVTPVVLPGYDDPDHLRRKANRDGVTAEQKRKFLDQLNARIDGLLRKAIVQSGLTATLAKFAVIDWRKVGFLPGVDLADRYGAPSHLKRYPRYHVRIHFCDAQGVAIEVPGPICIGGGRFYGLGLLVREAGWAPTA